MAIWDDYARFHRLALETQDVDPVYPVLRQLAVYHGLSAEDRIRLVMRYVAYYHLGSGLAAFLGEKGPLPCATERRGHRDARKLARHLDGLRSVEALPGGWERWIRNAIQGSTGPRDAWGKLNDALLDIWGNGRWASFKTSELLWKVCSVRVEATDMGHAHSSGPRQGMDLLLRDLPKGNSKEAVRELDKVSEIICRRLEQEGLHAPVEEVETTLCDFHALATGRYYVGHDIDQMLRQLLDVQSAWTQSALEARFHTLPNPYLGEIYGWTGPDPVRKRAYRDTGKILERI
jgi:hypothetical protein